MRKPPQQASSEARLHVPVLLGAVLSYLDPKPGETYLDLTVGYGGHSKEIGKKLGNHWASQMTLVDQDAWAEAAVQSLVADGATFIRSDFLSAARQLASEGRQFDMILADLGVSSPQLDESERGFSFARSGPLDMRMDQRSPQSAADIVNRYSRRDLEAMIKRYGEEPHARAIALAIVQHRPFSDTRELADVIEQTIGRRGKIHPATRTFQAIRIELNQELAQIEGLMPLLPQLLTPGGRVAIISFHSLEDRIVKRALAEQAASGYEAELQLLTKHAIKGATEDVSNPRARSAVLRAAAKIKRKG